MKTEHTPTPWISTDENAETIPNWIGISYFDNGEMQDHIAYSHPDNAEFIVRAVNSHEALLAALKEVSNAANVCAAHDALNADYWFKKQTIVNKALAQAEGK